MSRTRKCNEKEYRRRRARVVVNKAICDGRLSRPDACDLCHRADRPIEGHHRDYSKPLVVDWLCARCHAAIHVCVRQLLPAKITEDFLPTCVPCGDDKYQRAHLLTAVSVQNRHVVSPDPSCIVERQELIDAVEAVLPTLPDKAQLVVSARYGLRGESQSTLREIANRLDCTGESIRLIEAKAVRKIRQALCKISGDYRCCEI